MVRDDLSVSDTVALDNDAEGEEVEREGEEMVDEVCKNCCASLESAATSFSTLQISITNTIGLQQNNQQTYTTSSPAKS